MKKIVMTVLVLLIALPVQGRVKKYNKKVLAPITDPALVQKAIDFGFTQAQATYDQRCNTAQYKLQSMKKIAVIGLGYVGLPLATAFSAKFKVLGFDNSFTRVEELNAGIDRVGQLSPEELKEITKSLTFSSLPDTLVNYDTVSYTHLTLPTNREV